MVQWETIYKAKGRAMQCVQLRGARQRGACSRKAYSDMAHWHAVTKASKMVCAVGEEHGDAARTGARMQQGGGMLTCPYHTSSPLYPLLSI